MDIKKLLRNWVIITVGVLIATHTSDNISYDDNIGTLVVVVLLMSFLNLLIKPLLLFFTLPFVILSLGIGIWIINALLFLLVGHLVAGFEVASWGAAMWGALMVSLTSIVGNALLGGRRVTVRVKRPGPPRNVSPPKDVRASSSRRKRFLPDDDDIIDI